MKQYYARKELIMKLKKIVSSALAAVLLGASMLTVGTTAADSELPFKDVGKKKWFYDEVKFVYENGLMQGTSTTLFEPDTKLTRAMFVTILGRLADAEQKETDRFSDIKKKTWYTGYVGWAVDAGIVNGYEDGTFLPDKALSREEMAACIARYINYMDISMPRESTAPSTFADAKKIGKWAREYVEILRRAGIANGDQYKKYNPKADITRAEMATVIMNIIDAEAKAWQGYTPSADDSSKIFGAKYLYWSGTAVSGSLDSELDEATAYPTLYAFRDSSLKLENDNYDPSGTIGVSANVLDIDLFKTPVLKVAYKYAPDAQKTLKSGVININGTEKSEFSLTAGVDDLGMKTATVDLTAVMSNYKARDFDTDFLHILLSAFDEEPADTDKLHIAYIGFFESMSAADKYSGTQNDDYLKNYFLYSSVKYLEYTADVEKKYDELLQSRIDEILNSESKLTPEQILASGHNCFYVSSINGDDSNKGTSPDKPLKTLEALWEVKAGGAAIISKAKEGDGVFLERGSTWYHDRYLDNSRISLVTTKNVSYGAYGTGPKPVISGAIEFDNGVGSWQKTEYENIYVLDKIDNDPAWCGEKSEVGNIIFNDGEYFGVRIKSTDEGDPFGEGKTAYCWLTVGSGTEPVLVSNGKEMFVSGGTTCGNIGEALNNDLEYFHDYKSGKLYLYSKDGNPAERFDDIKCSKSGYIVKAEQGTTFDNIAIKYSGRYGITGGRADFTMTNCEIGYIFGCFVETGMEIYGSSDNIRILNCYVHDVGGSLTCQNGGSESGSKGQNISNIEYGYNVIVSSITGCENWNGIGNLDENGYSRDKMINQHIHDNIFAYMGYSKTKTAVPAARSEVVSSSIYMEGENCIFENNTIMYAASSIYKAQMSSDTVDRGWICRDNTYIAAPSHAKFYFHYDDALTVNHKRYKNARITAPYNYRYLAYFTSLGIDTTGTYYYMSDETDERIINDYLVK